MTKIEVRIHVFYVVYGWNFAQLSVTKYLQAIALVRNKTITLHRLSDHRITDDTSGSPSGLYC